MKDKIRALPAAVLGVGLVCACVLVALGKAEIGVFTASLTAVVNALLPALVKSVEADDEE